MQTVIEIPFPAARRQAKEKVASLIHDPAQSLTGCTFTASMTPVTGSAVRPGGWLPCQAAIATSLLAFVFKLQF